MECPRYVYYPVRGRHVKRSSPDLNGLSTVDNLNLNVHRFESQRSRFESQRFNLNSFWKIETLFNFRTRTNHHKKKNKPPQEKETKRNETR